MPKRSTRAANPRWRACNGRSILRFSGREARSGTKSSGRSIRPRAVAYAQTQLDNTVIKAPVSGTILDRNVEKGEFVTTGFVGDKGAKGYLVTMADLSYLQVELDISQNDFPKLGRSKRESSRRMHIRTAVIRVTWSRFRQKRIAPKRRFRSRCGS